MTSPTVSVVIPTFNRSDVITNAIDSVLGQTYQDYELIVVDDGSTDDTGEILKPYFAHMRYYRQSNRGASVAQNKGIELAKGKWISILASDDIWLPTKLERQINAVKAFGDRTGACFTDCIYFGDHSLTLSAFQAADLQSKLEFGILDDPIKYIMGRHTPIWVQSLLVLRSLVLEINGFDETMTTQEDTDLLFRLALKTTFCFVAMPLVKIDSTPSRPRLRDLDTARKDGTYARAEYRYQKWLGLDQLSDGRIHEAIRENLCSLYYSWTITYLYGFRISKAIGKIRQIRNLGESYSKITRTFTSLALGKMRRNLLGD
jgi:glycosyltransferase involved in cell wall biosynthesis